MSKRFYDHNQSEEKQNMFSVERKKNELIISGPDGYRKRLDPEGVGIVVRLGEFDLERFTIKLSACTDEEIVGIALEIPAYPI